AHVGIRAALRVPLVRSRGEAIRGEALALDEQDIDAAERSLRQRAQALAVGEHIEQAAPLGEDRAPDLGLAQALDVAQVGAAAQRVDDAEYLGGVVVVERQAPQRAE